MKIWRVAIRSSIYGREIINTLHVKADNEIPFTDRSASDVADDVWDWLGTAYKAVLDDSSTVLDLELREEPQATVPDVPDTFIKSINEAGTYSNVNNLPVEFTMHLKSKTAAAVRSGHGGMFLPPPLGSNQLSGDGLTFSSTGTYWVAAGDLADTLLEGHDWESGGSVIGHESYVIYSRVRRDRGDENYFFDVTSIIRNPRPTWLRSRAS